MASKRRSILQMADDAAILIHRARLQRSHQLRGKHPDYVSEALRAGAELAHAVAATRKRRSGKPGTRLRTFRVTYEERYGVSRRLYSVLVRAASAASARRNIAARLRDPCHPAYIPYETGWISVSGPRRIVRVRCRSLVEAP
jgi:hypothetical protein